MTLPFSTLDTGLPYCSLCKYRKLSSQEENRMNLTIDELPGNLVSGTRCDCSKCENGVIVHSSTEEHVHHGCRYSSQNRKRLTKRRHEDREPPNSKKPCLQLIRKNTISVPFKEAVNNNSIKEPSKLFRRGNSGCCMCKKKVVGLKGKDIRDPKIPEQGELNYSKITRERAIVPMSESQEPSIYYDYVDSGTRADDIVHESTYSPSIYLSPLHVHPFYNDNLPPPQSSYQSYSYEEPDLSGTDVEDPYPDWHGTGQLFGRMGNGCRWVPVTSRQNVKEEIMEDGYGQIDNIEILHSGSIGNIADELYPGYPIKEESYDGINMLDSTNNNRKREELDQEQLTVPNYINIQREHNLKRSDGKIVPSPCPRKSHTIQKTKVESEDNRKRLYVDESILNRVKKVEKRRGAIMTHNYFHKDAKDDNYSNVCAVPVPVDSVKLYPPVNIPWILHPIQDLPQRHSVPNPFSISARLLEASNTNSGRSDIKIKPIRKPPTPYYRHRGGQQREKTIHLFEKESTVEPKEETPLLHSVDRIPFALVHSSKLFNRQTNAIPKIDNGYEKAATTKKDKRSGGGGVPAKSVYGEVVPTTMNPRISRTPKCTPQIMSVVSNVGPSSSLFHLTSSTEKVKTRKDSVSENPPSHSHQLPNHSSLDNWRHEHGIPAREVVGLKKALQNVVSKSSEPKWVVYRRQRVPDFFNEMEDAKYDFCNGKPPHYFGLTYREEYVSSVPNLRSNHFNVKPMIVQSTQTVPPSSRLTENGKHHSSMEYEPRTEVRFIRELVSRCDGYLHFVTRMEKDGHLKTEIASPQLPDLFRCVTKLCNFSDIREAEHFNCKKLANKLGSLCSFFVPCLKNQSVFEFALKKSVWCVKFLFGKLAHKDFDVLSETRPETLKTSEKYLLLKELAKQHIVEQLRICWKQSDEDKKLVRPLVGRELCRRNNGRNTGYQQQKPQTPYRRQQYGLKEKCEYTNRKWEKEEKEKYNPRKDHYNYQKRYDGRKYVDYDNEYNGGNWNRRDNRNRHSTHQRYASNRTSGTHRSTHQGHENRKN